MLKSWRNKCFILLYLYVTEIRSMHLSLYVYIVLLFHLLLLLLLLPSHSPFLIILIAMLQITAEGKQ